MHLSLKRLQNKNVPLILLGLIFCALIYSQMAYSQTSSENTTGAGQVDISGTYICFGTDFSDKSDYTAQITATKEGEVFYYEGAEQGIDNTVNTFEGRAIFAKDSKDTFASVFWQKHDLNKTGVVIYKIQPNGVWDGIWKWKDKPDINIEQCKKRESSSL